MPHFAASDLGLHCLHMSHKKDIRLIWVKAIMTEAEDNLLTSVFISGQYVYHQVALF